MSKQTNSKQNQSRSQKDSEKLLIKNYGLFWLTDKVNWGKTGYSGTGTLLGKSKKGGKTVDFANQIGIYALYNSDFSLVYVGQSDQRQSGTGLKARLGEQRRDLPSGSWDRFSWFGLKKIGGKKNYYELLKPTGKEHPKREIILDHFEAILLYIATPRLNGQKGKWQGRVEQFIQQVNKEESKEGAKRKSRR